MRDTEREDVFSRMKSYDKVSHVEPNKSRKKTNVCFLDSARRSYDLDKSSFIRVVEAKI